MKLNWKLIRNLCAVVAALGIPLAYWMHKRNSEIAQAQAAAEAQRHNDDVKRQLQIRAEDRQAENKRELAKAPFLHVYGKEFAPNGPSAATQVYLANAGEFEAVVQRVIFRPTASKDTPSRQALTQMAPALPVNFFPGNYVKVDWSYVVVLAKPRPVPGKEGLNLELSIVDPDQVGKTLLGTVTVIYDGDKELMIENVEIDVLAKPPELPKGLDLSDEETNERSN